MEYSHKEKLARTPLTETTFGSNHKNWEESVILSEAVATAWVRGWKQTLGWYTWTIMCNVTFCLVQPDIY